VTADDPIADLTVSSTAAVTAAPPWPDAPPTAAPLPRRPPRFSLRARLLLAVTVVALVGLLVADIATYAALKSFLVDRIDTSLDTANRPLANFLLGPTDPGGFGTDAADRAALAAAAPGAYVDWRASDGAPIRSGSTRGPYTTDTPRLPTEVSGLRDINDVRYFTVHSRRDGGPDFRVRAEQLRDGSTLMVALPLDEVGRTLHQLIVIELVVTGAALLAAVLLGLWLVRIGLKPLRDIESTASSIASGDLSLRVPEDDRTEVGRLGASLNTMLGYIEDAFARQAASEEQLRRFVADASHELRTPLSAVSAYAELFERGAHERPADLARVMRGIRVETARMQMLIDDLLLLARLDEGRPLAAERVDLVAVLDDAVDAARAVGPDWPITLDAPDAAEVIGDPNALRQVMDNLLANVRTHTPSGTRAVVSVGSDGSEIVLAVTDEGPGVDPDDAARVFERFYRVDPSRSRVRGGSGLGLAVVASIVGAHGGRVDVESSPGEGATFRVHLPLAAAPVAQTDPGSAVSAGVTRSSDQ
jgi:two-component system, OmpR family, sensor kinase